MDFEQIFLLIIVVLSFIGPAIRKLFESNKGAVAKPNRSREEVRKYLEKMRQLQQRTDQGDQQQNHQQQNSYVELTTLDEPEEQKTSSHFKGFDRISNLVEEDVNKHVEQHIHPITSTLSDDLDSSASSKSTNESKLNELVLENEKFNDIQRAFVLAEIFNKPKALSDI